MFILIDKIVFQMSNNSCYTDLVSNETRSNISDGRNIAQGSSLGRGKMLYKKSTFQQTANMCALANNIFCHIPVCHIDRMKTW